MKKLYSNKLVILSLVLPGLLLFVFAILAPICLSVYYGFTDYSGMGSYNYIGLENYHRLMKDQVFWTSLKNSLLLAIGFICIQHPLALIVAAVLDKLGGRGEGFFRCVYFVPNVISVAVIAYLWKFIYNPDFGLLNNIIKLLGGDGGINWLSQGRAIWSVLIVLIWHGFGWGMLIYYTGIKNIDPTLYEAAAIDGGQSENHILADHPSADEAGDSGKCDHGGHIRIKTDGDRVPAYQRRARQQHAVCCKLLISAGV